MSGRASPDRSALASGTAWALFALAGGALFATAFGMEPMRVVPWIGLAPLLLLLDRPKLGRLAFLWGMAFWLVSLHWIVPTIVTFGGLSVLLSWPLFSLLAAVLSLFVVGFAFLARRAWTPRRPLVAMTGVAAAWVISEWARTWFIGGFPWNLAGYAWLGRPGALAASAWIGAYGVSFLLVWANAGVARGVLDRSWRPVAWGLLLPMAILGSAWRWNEHAIADPSPGGAPFEAPFEARILQPNIPNLPEWDATLNAEGYRRLVAQSFEACDRPGVLVIWPESAAWPRVLGRDAELDRDVRALGARGCGVLMNLPRQQEGKYYNSAVLVDANGGQAFYDKRHLVPFGEFVPFRAVLPFVDALTRHVGDFTPGEEVRLLDYSGARLGGAICYEVVYPQEVADTVMAGATVLFSVTNDDWYGPTSAAWQHLAAARFRAAESRRMLLRAAVTGVSAVIGPNGALLDHVPPDEQRTMRVTAVPRSDLTVYTRVADFIPWLAIGVCCFAIFLAARADRRALISTKEAAAR